MRKRVNVRPLLRGPVFVPLRDPDFFALVKLDRAGGTVLWPNGADLAPEALHDLPAEREPTRGRPRESERTVPAGISPMAGA